MASAHPALPSYSSRLKVRDSLADPRMGFKLSKFCAWGDLIRRLCYPKDVEALLKDCSNTFPN